ncbi:arylamine N-acetyltransferase 2-like [Engraulis encrasicolus]|uniref:arylamine N-acetyltransferase 2-like n=1 Tax=Engraulis encrasicolus TaxID=184585 RepID=UPI002FD2C22A
MGTYTTSRKLLIPDEHFAKSYLGARGPINPVYCFTLQPRQFGDFHAAFHFLQTNPDSLYANKSICALPTPMEYRALVGWVYREVTFAYQDEFDLMEIRRITDDEVQDVLREKFGLPIAHNLTLKNNRIIYTIAFKHLKTYNLGWVEVEGSSYIADTSFGLADQILEPLELVSGKEQPQPGGTFCLRQDGGNTWTLDRTVRPPQIPNEEFAKSSLVIRIPVNKVFCFTLEPRKLDDLRAIGEFEVTFAYQEKFDLMDMRRITYDEVQDLLREKFGLPTIPKLQLKNNRGVFVM